MRTLGKSIMACCFIFLGAAGLKGAAHLTVPATDVPPVIDGKIGERNEWRNAVRITNFQNAEKVGFAMEQTTVWLTHDKQTLYLAMKMNSRVLEHASNMRSRFLAQITQPGPDKEIWNDDSVEIRLLPPWVKKQPGFSHFYLILNANGVSASLAPEGFDKDWRHQVEIRTSIDEGFWAVELAIPMKALGRTAPDDSGFAGWRCNFIRFEQNLKEKSSFENILARSHNDPALFALLDLADNTFPALKMPDITNGQIEEVTLEAYVAKRFTGWWWSSLRFLRSNKPCDFNGQAIFPEGDSRLTLRNECGKKGLFTWKYYVIYSTPPKMLFRTPDYPMNANDGPAMLELAGQKSVTGIVFNNRVLAPGAGIALSPRHGENILQLNSTAGEVKLRLVSSDAAWKIPLVKWEYFNGKAWLPATVEEQSDFIAVSAPEKLPETQFRTVFYAKATSLDWFGEASDAFYITEAGTGGFFWNASRTNGIDMKETQNVSLTLVVPSWLEVAGAASRQCDESIPMWKNMMKQENIYRLDEGKNMKADGGDFTVYTVTTDQLNKTNPKWDISEERVHYRTRGTILLRARPGAAGGQGKIGYYMTIDGRPELPSFRDVICLPPLQGAQPEKSRITMYLNHFDQLNDRTLMDAVFTTVKAAGGTEVYLNNVYCPSDQYGIVQTHFFQMRAPAQRSLELDMSSIFKKFPQARATWGGFPNLSFLLRTPEAWEDLDQEFAAMKRRTPHLRNLNWDYEFRPFAHYSDLSAYTLDIFTREYGIKEERLDEKVIRDKYFDQWVDFRCKELARIVAKLRPMANRHGFEFTMYMAGDPARRKDYSVDMKDIAEFGGLDHIYFGGTWDHTVTGKIKALCAAAGARMSTSVHVCATDNTGWTRGVILRRLMIAAGGGVLLWYEKGFDGLMLQEIAAVTALLAKFEDFFLQGKADAFAVNAGKVVYSPENRTPEHLKQRILGDVISDMPALAVYELDGRFLALAVNDTAAPVELTLNFAGARGQVTEFGSGDRHTAGEDIKRKIPPHQYSAFYGEIK